MEQIMALLQTVVPILVCIGLGFLARKKELLTPEQVGGVQQFVLKFCIPPVLFNSCLEAKIGAENLTTMVMLLPVLFDGIGGALPAGRMRPCMQKNRKGTR